MECANAAHGEGGAEAPQPSQKKAKEPLPEALLPLLVSFLLAHPKLKVNRATEEFLKADLPAPASKFQVKAEIKRIGEHSAGKWTIAAEVLASCGIDDPESLRPAKPAAAKAPRGSLDPAKPDPTTTPAKATSTLKSFFKPATSPSPVINAAAPSVSPCNTPLAVPAENGCNSHSPEPVAGQQRRITAEPVAGQQRRITAEP
eukprot:gene2316-3040_t